MSEMNFEVARHNMIEQQIRPWEVLDQRVLDVMAQVPREDFVPRAYRKLAFADMNLPLGRGEVMMAPKVEARMLQALDVQPTDKVLEIGTGSGYVTALLASLGGQVHSVDIIPEFKLSAQEKLSRHGYRNTGLEVGDGSRGYPRHGPYDVIAITGALFLWPEAYLPSLAVGGRLFAIVGEPPVRDAVLVTRVGKDEWTREYLFETELPALANAPEPPRFIL